MSRLLEELEAAKQSRTAAPRQRILFFDIESAPMLSFLWSAKVDGYINPDAITHESYMLTWAAKWAGQKTVHAQRLTSQEAVDQDDGRIVQGLADMIRKADAVVAHNGARFDIPKLNARLLLLGLEPLGPVKMIDTLTIARSSFKLASNKLDYLAQHLGVGAKLHTGFDLWKRCYRGDEAALKKMDRYCRQDVRILESVFWKIAPYAKGLPRMVDARHENELVCPFCGHDQLERDGEHRTNASTYPIFRCLHGPCGRRFRSRSADPSKRLALVPV